MRYRQAIPYPLRFVVALAGWATIVALDFFLRFAFVFVMPFAWLIFGNQPNSGLVTFYTRPFMRMPKADLGKLLPRRRRASATKPVFLEESGDGRV